MLIYTFKSEFLPESKVYSIDREVDNLRLLQSQHLNVKFFLSFGKLYDGNNGDISRDYSDMISDIYQRLHLVHEIVSVMKKTYSDGYDLGE